MYIVMYLEDAEGMAEGIDTDQAAPKDQSHLSLYCC